MLELTVAECARVLDGALHGAGAGRVRRAACDSREIGAGDLFFALPGARTDGHVFLEEIRRRDAAAAVVQPDRGARPPGLPVILVSDPLAALAALARFHLGRLGAETVGITGSVGKTTAKDFLAHLLGGEAEGVRAAPRSYNSECGLPLAILSAPRGTRRLVLEYGINAPGEMERLLSIAVPRHGFLTALTEAHLEGLGDRATLVREKLRLPAALREGGWNWLPAALEAEIGAQAAEWAGQVRWCGLDGRDGRGRVLDPRPGAFRVALPRVGEVVLPVLARHEAELAAMAARAALDLGAAPAAVAARLATLVRPPGRLTLHRFGGFAVLDDAYNASPAAMKAALDLLAGWPGARRRIAVLGTMEELGPAAAERHRGVGRHLAALGVEILLGVGRGGAWIAEGAGATPGRPAARTLDTVSAAAGVLAGFVRPGDVVLLKASRRMGLDGILPRLAEAAGPGLLAGRRA